MKIVTKYTLLENKLLVFQCLLKIMLQKVRILQIQNVSVYIYDFYLKWIKCKEYN